jgi:16S rRNA (guanine527-N7)-methyltransferase
MLTWNARTNLTAIKTDQEALLKHYADSIIMTEILPETGRVLDVGSGGGFPGLPLAVVRDDLEWTLLEPRQKRVSFLRATIARLGLKNVTVIAGRSDETPRGISDVAVTRATFSDVDSARTVLNWLVPGGCLYALRSLDAAAWPDAVAGTYRFGEHVRRIDCLS